MNCLRRFVTIVALFSPAAAVAEECEGLDSIGILTANELFDAAIVCEDLVDAVGMMMIGQIRAMSDLAIFEPAALPDRDEAANLYKRIYGNLGSIGPDDVYRDSSAYEAMRNLVESWQPKNISNYSPGWNALVMPTASEYSSVILQQKNRRLEQLDQHYLLISNDEYYDLKLQAREIWARNNNQLEANSEDGQLVRELNDQMKEIRDQLTNAQ
jgi:hypothetical protein